MVNERRRFFRVFTPREDGSREMIPDTFLSLLVYRVGIHGSRMSHAHKKGLFRPSTSLQNRHTTRASIQIPPAYFFPSASFRSFARRTPALASW